MVRNDNKLSTYISGVKSNHILIKQKENINVVLVIPTYNEERFIGNLLNKLSNQQYKEFEVIVVDNGSVDNTKAVIENFISKVTYPLYLICEEKPGPGNARKRGMDEAAYRFYGKDKSLSKNNYIIVTTDADVTPSKEWLYKINSSFNSSKVGGLAGTHIADPEIDKIIESRLGLKSYFADAHNLIIYLEKNDIGQIKMSGPNSSFSAKAYCYAGGIEQPYVGTKVGTKEVKYLQDKIAQLGYIVGQLETPVITSQRRHLYELIHGGIHGQYITTGVSPRFLVVRATENILLNKALKIVPKKSWESYHDKIISSVLKNVIYTPFEQDMYKLEDLISKLRLKIDVSTIKNFNSFYLILGVPLLERAGIPVYSKR